MKTIYFLLALTLCSCGANYHLKRAERHLLKAQLKGAQINTDTIFVDKPVVIQEVKHDTVIQVQSFNDTIVVEKDRIITKVKINPVTKEVFIESKCKADTVRIRVPVTITKEIKAGKSGLDLWVWIIAALAVGFFLGKFIRL